MKQILPAMALFFAAHLAQAQCTPDPSATSPGIYPNFVENLDPATVGVAYSETITIVVPADTTVEVIPGFPTTVPINNIKVNNVLGLPSGFSYACNPSSCIFPGGSTHCAVITGTATAGQEGTYALGIAVTYDVGLTQDDTVYGYVLNVNPVGVAEIVKNTTIRSKVSPNPFSVNAEVSFITPVATDVKISVFNLLGKVVRTENMKASAGENTYTLKGAALQPGIYLVEVSDGRNKSTQKLIKQ